MGLLDYFDPDALRGKLKGLLGGMPLTQAMRGEAKVTPEGLKAGLLAMKPFSGDAGQTAYDAAMNIGPLGLGKIVYHGSPHKFDKFDASKIGTGEGAQAYGHGVYLADAEDVAKGYQKTLAYKAFDLGPEAEKRGLKLTAGARGEFHRQAAANTDPMRAARGLQNANISARDLPQEKLAELFDAFQKDGTGALYKADLPDEWIPKMLDWDKPLSQQPETVRALKALGASDGKHLFTIEGAKPLKDMRGSDAYEFLKQEAYHGEPAWAEGIENAGTAASTALHQSGIPGIRYLDGGSRGKGQGSYNYVVFPGLEDKVKILERNGIKIQ